MGLRLWRLAAGHPRNHVGSDRLQTSVYMCAKVPSAIGDVRQAAKPVFGGFVRFLHVVVCGIQLASLARCAVYAHYTCRAHTRQQSFQSWRPGDSTAKIYTGFPSLTLLNAFSLLAFLKQARILLFDFCISAQIVHTSLRVQTSENGCVDVFSAQKCHLTVGPFRPCPRRSERHCRPRTCFSICPGCIL